MKKKLNFHIFRYHLIPTTTDENQTKLFDKEKMTIEELKERKNSFLKEIILNSDYNKNPKNLLKIEHYEDDHFFIKFAQKKSTKITQNFENFEIENEPYVYIIINNEHTTQKIAISENLEAFSKPAVVRNHLKTILNKGLAEFGLNIEIEELFNPESFWRIVQNHRFELKQIDFKYIKPNLAAISKSLPIDFRNFTDNVNSHESRIIINAPKNGILENVDKKNSTINGLVEYTSEGAGDIKIKIKGSTKKYSTKKNPVIVKEYETTIEGPIEQVIKAYKSII